MSSNIRILVVDDEEIIREGCKDILEEEGYVIETAMDGKKALEWMKRIPSVDIAIVDLVMPGMDGIELLKKIKTLNSTTIVIMITGYATVGTAVKAMKEGAFDYIPKPFSPDEMRIIIKRAVDYLKLQKENIFLQEEVGKGFQLENIVGNSPRMQEVFRIMKKVAPTRSTVMIYGESGTGKELIARAIHLLSPRKERPFIPVSCGTLSETLLESELFGHTKGSFTGAYITKPGLLEVADAGTFFLDEIGDVSLTIQGKLLRVLQEREFIPVGGTRSVKVDIRLIAATNKDLQKGIEEGSFREDLFYRLNIIPIYLPPLRERKEDIPALAYQFLKKYSVEMKKKITKISDEAMLKITQYDWPGNVRELENAIERAVILASGDYIETIPLFGEIKDIEVKQTISYRDAKQEMIDAFHRNFLIRLLKINKGNVTLSALQAKINRRNFQKLLKKYGIKPSQFKK